MGGNGVGMDMLWYKKLLAITLSGLCFITGSMRVYFSADFTNEQMTIDIENGNSSDAYMDAV